MFPLPLYIIHITGSARIVTHTSGKSVNYNTLFLVLSTKKNIMKLNVKTYLCCNFVRIKSNR